MYMSAAVRQYASILMAWVRERILTVVLGQRSIGRARPRMGQINQLKSSFRSSDLRYVLYRINTV